MISTNLFWEAWWPQWRSHWRVLHAWPVSAQAVMLTGVTLLMSLWLSWHVSGDAWCTWWQASLREAQAEQQRQALQQQVAQHRARLASLQAMQHPSGQDWPAWVSLSASGSQALGQAFSEVLASAGVQTQQTEGGAQQWRGTLPALLVAWQNQAQAMPHTRVSAWALRPVPGEWATDRVPHFSLELQTRDNAVQVLASSKPAEHTAQLAKPYDGGSASLYNPFNATWLSQGLPARPRLARQVGLPDVALSQWHWLGALNAPGQSRALLSHEGRHFSVAVGQALGADGGEVVQVNKDHLQLLEWGVDAQGQWQSRTVRWPAKEAP